MPQTGLYGKMPSVGDFVSRGFSAALCEGLDRLLQSALAACTSEGADARQLMEQAKPVMISIRPGALCSTGFIGLWFPSRDRVGRVFPLCVGLEIDADQSKLPLFWPSEGLTMLLGTSLMQVLQAGGGPDELMAVLPPAAEWQAILGQRIPFSDVGDETVPDFSYRATLFALEGPLDRMSLPSRALGSRLPWVVQMLGTVVGADGRPEWYFGSRTMLSWTHFAALFDGRWAHWEWSVSPLKVEPVMGDETLPAPLQLSELPMPEITAPTAVPPKEGIA